MKKLILSIFLTFALAANAHGVTALNADVPYDTSKMSTFPSYERETRAKVNELVALATVPDAQDWRVVTVSATAAAGDKILIDTSSVPCTVTPPANPSVGQFFMISDMARTFAINNVTIEHGTGKINGASADLVISVPRIYYIVYKSTDYGWAVSFASDFNPAAPDPIGSTIPAAGTFTTLTGTTTHAGVLDSSSTIDSSLTASKPVFTNGSKKLVSTGTLAVDQGGTGATTAADARTALGAAASATTVNGHALTSNVTVSATDITTGTLPHAQLPSLVSGDIPNNAANTSGNAATATNLAAAVALPNGTTASTQSASDNSTKLATTQYVESAIAAIPGGSVGQLVKVTVLTSTTADTFTTQPSTTKLLARMVGGGGGGAGVANASAAESSFGIGGGQALLSEKLFTVTGSTGYSFTCGSGGTAGASGGGSGGDGGTTTLTVGGVTLSAWGGRGGNVYVASGTTATAVPAVAMLASAPGSMTNADSQNYGSFGSMAIRLSGTIAISGGGGNSIYGAGGLPATSSSPGCNASLGYGAGGSGALSYNAGGAQAGCVGGQGCIVVYEYK